MKIYAGHLGPDRRPAAVMVMEGEPDDEATRQYPLEHHVQHSPDGFSWGYRGSGPAELARCLLWDHLGAQPIPALYQDFKAEVVADWPQDEEWRLSQAALRDWLASWEVGHPGWPLTQDEAMTSLEGRREETPVGVWPRRLSTVNGGHVFMQPALGDETKGCPMGFSCSPVDLEHAGEDYAVELTPSECLELARFLLGEALISAVFEMVDAALEHAVLR